jgi:hypothetical protein
MPSSIGSRNTTQVREACSNGFRDGYHGSLFAIRDLGAATRIQHRYGAPDAKCFALSNGRLPSRLAKNVFDSWFLTEMFAICSCQETTEVHNWPPVSSCKNKEGEHRRKSRPALADYWLAGTLALPFRTAFVSVPTQRH